MKILMLVNWNIRYCSRVPTDKQPPDYVVPGERYWFFRYFKRQDLTVDVIDTSSFPWIEKFEHYKMRFYLIQALKAIPKLNQYDLVISHGMQSGVVISLYRRFFRTGCKHIVVDVGAFNSAAERGMAMRLMQFSSKSIDGIIYHTKCQQDYYRRFYPWIFGRSKFIHFGTDLEYFDPGNLVDRPDKDTYFVCVGASKRDWKTLIEAYRRIDTKVKLRIIGAVQDAFKGIEGVEQLPRVPIDELIRQIYNAKFCVLPLKAYNYSYGQMTLLQQMALRKCVLTARVPSMESYVIDGETGIYYHPENIASCEAALRQVLDDEELILRIGNNARDYLEKHCNEKQMALEIEGFCSDIWKESLGRGKDDDHAE